MTATSSSVPISPTSSGALASSSLSTLDDPLASSSSTPSAASPSPSKNPFNPGPSRNLSTILPGFLIAFICVIGVFLLCGVFHGRRRRARRAGRTPPILVQPPSGVLPQVRTRKKKKRVVKPKLWEVDIKALSGNCDVEGLQPVAVELLADSTLKTPGMDEKRPNRLLPSFTHSLPPVKDDSPTQQAQVTVLLTMPAPYYQIDLRSREYVIGTTCLFFKPEDDTDDEDEKRGEESERHEESRRVKQRFERFAFR